MVRLGVRKGGRAVRCCDSRAEEGSRAVVGRRLYEVRRESWSRECCKWLRDRAGQIADRR
jgi:hypothetical protein